MAVVQIKNSDISSMHQKQECKIHLMPCTIIGDEHANVSKFFEPSIRKQSDEFLEVSFRGYPLIGRDLKIPNGYQGYILQENNIKLNEDSERTIYLKESFSKLTYWNYDGMPSTNDKICGAIDWISLSNAIHEPTAQEDK